MVEILQAFGVDWRLIVIQIFNFTLMLAILWYFLYTPVLAIIKERGSKIEKGVRDADLAEQALTHAAEEKRRILTEANKEAEGISKRSKDQADIQRSLIIQQAEERAHMVLADAKSKNEQIKQQALRESEAEIAKLALLAAEKILRENSKTS